MLAWPQTGHFSITDSSRVAVVLIQKSIVKSFVPKFPTVLPKRYDAFMYLDRTRALHPLHLKARHAGEVPETYPSGV